MAKLDAAPYDDEELADEDLSAIRDARNEPAISWSDAEAELNTGLLCARYRRVGTKVDMEPQ
jgi:hypothetical protein